MRTFKALRGAVLGACLAAGLFGVVASGATAAPPLNVCVPEKLGIAVVTPTTTGCKPKYNPSRLLPQAEAEELEKIKQAIKYVTSGVSGKTTIKFSGVNVQVVAGATEAETTGLGNVVVGNDETEAGDSQTGSNNLIVGSDQTFTSYGGLVVGLRNKLTEPWASVSGGTNNTAAAFGASVSGGYQNSASGAQASVSGGNTNKATGTTSSASGGLGNTASGGSASVSGGQSAEAKGSDSSVSGGDDNTAQAEWTSVSGGDVNKATVIAGAVSGGYSNVASG